MRALYTLTLALLLSTAGAAAAQQPEKKVLVSSAFDGWQSIRDETLSDDGRWVVYSLVPQVGDGEVVVRRVPSGPEYRHTRGFIAPPQTKTNAPRGRGSAFPAARFSRDARFVVFTIEPMRAQVERAARSKRKRARKPSASLGIMSTADGKVTVVPRVKSFRLASTGRYLAYLLQARNDSASDSTAADSTRPASAAAAVPGGVARPIASDSTGKKARKTYGTTLVLRDLTNGSETRIADVLGYEFDAHGDWLGYTVASRTAARNGAYLRSLADGKPVTLLSGAGRYRMLSFDEAGTQVVFLSDRDAPHRDTSEANDAGFALYHASLASARGTRSHGGARALVTPAMLGDTLIVAADERIRFSADGTEIQFGVAPVIPDSVPADSLADKAVFDLWHWKDARLQPEQRIEASRDRNKSYPAVYLLDDARMRVLGSDSLPRIQIARNGKTALAVTEVPYALEATWGEGGYDVYVIDVATGTRTLVTKRTPFRATLSPGGRYVMYFGTDAHWHSYAVATGRTADLTGALTGVRFDEETWDRPSTPAPWGIAGWTRDDRSVLLYDRYDIWALDPAGAKPARMVTDSVGRRAHTAFRIVELDTAATALDPAQTIMLSAVNQETMASGLWRDRLGTTSAPVKLMMVDRRVANVSKAQDADVYLFTQSTFREFPNLWVAAGGRFGAATKVSSANPQQADYRWGTAELVHWLSDDGVPLKGILFKPDDFDPTRQYPMMVYMYEQLSQNLHAYVPPAGRNIINPTVYVSNGYVVFEPDIHYETGYPGPSALKSIVPGVQMLIDSGFVNPKAVGVQGHSWGGYQTAFMITRTSIFRAAMAGAPVANMTSAYGGIRWQTGISRAGQYEHTQSRIGGNIWEYPMRYLQNSPLFAADRITTPLLMMANDADGAVPWYQGIELFVAMRRLGKEVYLINYNGEGHNPTKRANQLDIAMRMQQFFDHYLKGAPAPAWMEHGIPFLDKGRDEIATTPSAATMGNAAGEKGAKPNGRGRP
jgi:dipeptidyl aminopeptidase/acylaminoacyl peptidase